MELLLSRKIQLLIFIGYLLLSVLLAYLWLASGYAVERVVSFYNFMGEVDASGILIFSGVAAALIYRNPSLNYFREIAFLMAFSFSIAQASVAAMEKLTLNSSLTFLHLFLISSIVIFGFGFVLFTILAMLAHSKESKDKVVSEERKKSGDNQSANFTVNLNLSVKSGSEQPSHAPADLAHDLRYSRSRARRSRGRR